METRPSLPLEPNPTVTALRSLAELSLRVQQTMAPIAAEIQRIGKALNPVWEQARIGLEKIGREWHCIADDLKSANYHLAACGWTVPAGFSIPDLRQLARMAASGSDVESLVVAAYEDSDGALLKELLADLSHSALLARWHPLLAQSIAAFEREDYAITIPALFTILEGSIAQVAGEVGTRRINVPKMVGRLASEEEEAGAFLLWWHSIAGFASDVYCHDSFSREATNLNRHRVLHGRDNPVTWGRIDVLRLFNALGTIDVLAEDR